MLNAKMFASGFVLAIVVALVMFWVARPPTVKAQGPSGNLPPGNLVSGAAACTNGSTSAVNAAGGSFPFGGAYPVFACMADLDGTGHNVVIIGFVASYANYTGMNEVYKVAIINGNGSVRADVPIN